jgi:hypothetical protein
VTNRIVALDLAGFSVEEHLFAARQITIACPSLRVAEHDQRHLRNIDRQSVQLGCALISATCALIALTISVRDKIQNIDINAKASPRAELVADIERACGTKLGQHVTEQVLNCRFSRDSQNSINLDIGKGKYEIEVLIHDTIFIRGHPK